MVEIELSYLPNPKIKQKMPLKGESCLRRNRRDRVYLPPHYSRRPSAVLHDLLQRNPFLKCPGCSKISKTCGRLTEEKWMRWNKLRCFLATESAKESDLPCLIIKNKGFHIRVLLQISEED